jgi:hypothetical protein
MMIDAAEFESILKQSMHETGVSVDPTKDMSPEDAAEWKRQNEKHKDKFKSAGVPENHQLKILKDTVKNPMKGKFLGGPSAEEAEETLRSKFKFTDKQITALKKASDGVSVADYEAELDKESKFERGENVSLEELPPELKENVENPPPAVKKLREEMESKSATDKEAAKLQARQIKILKDYITENSGRFVSWFDDLPQEVQSALVRVKDSETLHMDVDRWLGDNNKTAASGLYGFTKEAEKVCGSATNKLSKFTTKLAKDIYEKDSGTPAFLEEHTARTASKAARMLRGCMAEIGPGQPAKTAAKGEKGRYGFSAKTARLALEACNAVEHEAGVIASDLDARMGTKYAAITGFLNKHAKRAKCGWSDLILEAYPAQSEQIIASEEAVEKTASDLSGYEVHPSVAEILTWDGQGTPRAAASFLASEDDDLIAGRTWDGDKSTPDDATPYNIHPKSPPAGADGSEQRWKYNQWFRQNVCPGHKTNCGL